MKLGKKADMSGADHHKEDHKKAEKRLKDFLKDNPSMEKYQDEVEEHFYKLLFEEMFEGYEYDDEEEEVQYEKMESAFSDEIDEVDVSGSQGIYGDMDPAYDFDSDGPGSAGPYQTSSYNEDEDMDSSEELYPSFSSDGEFMGMSKPMGDMETNDEDEWEEIDTDLQEDFKTQKNKISEMFNRMSRYN